MELNLDNLKRVLVNYPIEFAYLYGSYADHSNRSWSDLDIALIIEEGLAQEKYFDVELEISKEIDEVLPCVESDVRIFNHAPLNYKIQIVQEGKLIYSRNEPKRVAFETGVRDEYFDFLPKKEEYRNALFDGIKKGGLLWSARKK